MERVGWLQARGHRPVCGWSWTARPASPAGRVVILVALILLKECRQRKHPPKFAIVVSGGSWGLVALLWPAWGLSAEVDCRVIFFVVFGVLFFLIAVLFFCVPTTTQHALPATALLMRALPLGGEGRERNAPPWFRPWSGGRSVGRPGPSTEPAGGVAVLVALGVLARRRHSTALAHTQCGDVASVGAWRCLGWRGGSGGGHHGGSLGCRVLGLTWLVVACCVLRVACTVFAACFFCSRVFLQHTSCACNSAHEVHDVCKLHWKIYVKTKIFSIFFKCTWFFSIWIFWQIFHFVIFVYKRIFFQRWLVHFEKKYKKYIF